MGEKDVKLDGNFILKTVIILITGILLNKQRKQVYQHFKDAKCTMQLPLRGLERELTGGYNTITEICTKIT